MKSAPKALIVAGYGLNCEAETAQALRMSGAQTETVHFNDLIAAPEKLKSVGLLVVGGGFSYGDHLGAGRALAIRFKFNLKDALREYVRGGGLVMGICNGFQILCKLGLLPGEDLETMPQAVSLMHNDSGVFRDDWIRLTVNPASPCVFTRGLDALEFPIRHGEGKFVARDEATLKRLWDNGQIVYQYCDAAGEATRSFPENPNGSLDAIAGICDPTGRIFGTMPHPEAAIYPEQNPSFLRARGLGETASSAFGRAIFDNAVRAMREDS